MSQYTLEEFMPMLRRAPMLAPMLVFLLALLISMPGLAVSPPVKAAGLAPPAGVSNAWVRAAAVPGRPAAGYLTIAGGGQPDTLVAVTAPGVRVEMHSMSMDGGVMKMARLDSVLVPGGTSVAFAPGGNHLMIFGMAGTPTTLPLTLVFRSGAKLTTVAEVRAPAAPASPPAAHAQH